MIDKENIWKRIVTLQHKFINEGDSLKANSIDKELQRLHKLLKMEGEQNIRFDKEDTEICDSKKMYINRKAYLYHKWWKIKGEKIFEDWLTKK